MPLFDYVCKCGVITEARRDSDVHTITCPACGKLAVRDLPRNVGLSGLPTRGAKDGRADH